VNTPKDIIHRIDIMQILQKPAPNIFQTILIESLGVAFRRGPKIGREAIFNLFFPLECYV
jgi:hypothetical protein